MKVCLIVDNPKRDLDGLVLVGWHLMKKGIDVVFVPMYEWHEVFFIKPDLVLVNYTRLANNKLISRCKKLNIAVGVLDTEGGILQSVEDYFKKALSYAKDVDLYCTWGKKQYDAIINQKLLVESKVALTGCPRYDFGNKPWNEILLNNGINNKRKVVLINTNFSFTNPKYNTPDKELNQLIEREGYDEQYAKELFAQTIKTNEKFNEVILKLSNDFPEIDFIIRPHPFENIEQYINLIKGQKNILVKQEGTVFFWIAKSKLLIHQNCSTAIESILMGVEPLNLKFISGPLLRQPVSEMVSQNIDSYDQLYGRVSKINYNEKLSVSTSNQKERSRLIEDWFYKSDGNASERVANNIGSVLIKRSKKRIKVNKYLLKMYKITLKQREYKKLILQLIFQIFGASGLKIIKSIFMPIDRQRDIGEKNISIKKVKDLIIQLSTQDSVKVKYTIVPYKNSRFNSFLLKK
jgi:surface carbohydrate biosynthesis protein